MKLFELLEPLVGHDEPDYKDNPPKRYSGRWKNVPQSKRYADNTAPDGSSKGEMGMYSRVKPSKDGHRVVKYQQRRTTKGVDPAYAYLRYVMENKLWKNPYFPKTHVIDTYIDREEEPLNKMEMEQLAPMESLSHEELLRVMDQIYDDNVRHKLTSLQDTVEQAVRWKKEPDISDHIWSVSVGLRDAIINTGTESLSKFKDRHLISAIETLREMIPTLRKMTDTEVVFDIHPGNIMVRRSQFGAPQLVFTDPVRGPLV